jgi:hypothetical protein
MELDQEVTRTPEINPLDITNDEKQKKTAPLINFSAAC